MITIRLTPAQEQWVEWAIEAFAVNAGPAYADDLADEQCISLDRAQQILDAQELFGFVVGADQTILKVPDPTPIVDEVVSDLGYRLLTQAADVAQQARESSTPAHSAWLKIRKSYEAAGGQIDEAIVLGKAHAE